MESDNRPIKLGERQMGVLARLIGVRQAELQQAQVHQSNAAGCQKDIEGYMDDCRKVLGVPQEHVWDQEALAFRQSRFKSGLNSGE